MSTKKDTKSSEIPDNVRSSPMEYVSINMLPRVVAGANAASEADIPGAGPAAPDPTPSPKDL